MGTRMRVVTVVAVALLAGAAMVAVLGGFGQRADGVVAGGLDAHFPSYPGTQMYPMGEALSLEGVPVQMGYFTASASPTEVAHFYADAWSKEGLSLTLSTSDARAEVGAYDEAGQSMRSISAVRQGNRVVTIASVVPLQQAPVVRGDDLPVPEAAMMVRRARSAEAGRAGQSVAYVLPGALTEAQEQVKAALGHDGWSLLRATPQPKLAGASLRMAKGPASALVTLVAEPETRTVGVQIQTVGAEASGP